LADDPALEVHVACVEDAPEIARLNLLFNGCDEPADRYAARLPDPHRVDIPILAIIAERAVGFANLRLLAPVFYPESYAELTELYVEEGARRQGVGRTLVRFAEQLALPGRRSGTVHPHRRRQSSRPGFLSRHRLPGR